MFNKILIANRGAIATRIIRTMHELDIIAIAVYAESDADSLHVRQADEAYCLGEGDATATYLNSDKILQIAQDSGAQAIHPGYGFLSENADFVERCETAGIAFIGPKAEQIRTFGLKHCARKLAKANNVPLLPGSEVLKDLPTALTEAERIGYPLMLKSSAGGGGIGMQLCRTPEELENAFDSVKRLSANNFADDSVFLEKFITRARHIEVQIFGDGAGQALALGERDCSSQRRNQKVIEECPAPNLTDAVRAQLHRTAEKLLSDVQYRSAGTVEFVLDADTQQFYFLEVNTRLQVEHGVTEEVYKVDLVAWMISLAADNGPDLIVERSRRRPCGHAVQVRLYAEDPFRDFQPCAGLLTDVSFPEGPGIRIDHWIEAGIDVPPWFDPMLAKVIVHADDRDTALAKLQQTLDQTRLYGSETNLDYLRFLTRDEDLAAGIITTRHLNNIIYRPTRIDVINGGTQTTVQDFPARQGYWDVGVPPSGPFDSYSFRLANRLLGNPDDAAGLEITLQGPTLRFSQPCTIVIAGAEIDAEINKTPIDNHRVITVAAGQTLVLGRIAKAGARAYLAVKGGIDCPTYLNSRSTFILGQFGGHNGRALRSGDVLHLRPSEQSTVSLLDSIPNSVIPQISHETELRVIYGPHGAPDFFTDEDIARFFAAAWEVHYNSSRTGIRLIGPKPQWARKDGGEAGMHPSNIHDNAYAFGSVDFTGDMPVILGPDGPSLGGFVCPATVISADLWKLGQLRAGDRVRFTPVSHETAVALEAAQQRQINSLTHQPINIPTCKPVSPILSRLDIEQAGETVVYRTAGDHFLLVEYGEQILDIRLRFRVHALMQWLQKNTLPGLRELTPGIRSLQIHFDSQQLDHATLLAHLQQAETELNNNLDRLVVPSRTIHIPLSWNDEACRLAVEKYQQSVRQNAPWCPDNLEFIRRINGLNNIEDVKKIVFDASYLVMGLGDVYLGAPVATPIDPQHRLVTTKYNPARTWTAENSVGIGGSYLCVYGMEGPGGYQFIGRTLQMWNRYRATSEFEQPWLLRFFDQIRFYEVSHEELMQIRKDFPQGRYSLRIEQGEFSLAEYQALLDDNSKAIDTFRSRRESAFAEELARWHRDGQFNFEETKEQEPPPEHNWPKGSVLVDSPVSGSVWQTKSRVGDRVCAGETLLVLESMKMEIELQAPHDGVITHVLLDTGKRVNAGQALVVMGPADQESII